MGKENSKAPIVDFSEKPHLYVKLSENIFLFQMFPFFIDQALPVLRYENNFLFDLLPSVSQSLKGFCKLFSFCLEMNQSLIASYHLWFRLCLSLLIPSNSFPNDLITSSSKKSITGSRFSSSLRRESFRNMR